MTRKVSDRRQNGYIAPFRFFEHLRSPRPPVDRIVSVLLEIGRGRVGKTVHANQRLTRFTRAGCAVGLPPQPTSYIQIK